MRRLRVVGLGDDDETVVLEDPIRHERFTVPGDERLRAAARGDVRRLGQMEVDSGQPLRPRDIQARIRAGESVEQVALGGGITSTHVERFAYPVLLERARVAELAGRAHPPTATGPDPRTLREIVTATLAGRGQDHEGARWDAWKAETGEWVVGLAWQAGRSDNTARWTYRPGPAGGVVTARDDPARELLGEAPVGGPRRVGEAASDAEPTTGATGDEVVAEPTDEDHAEDHAEEMPVAATGTGEARPRRPSGSSHGSTAKNQAGSATSSGSRRSRAARDVPDQRRAGKDSAKDGSRDSRDTGTAAGPGAASSPSSSSSSADEAKRKRHPIVPSWEDVLLGVRSPRE